MIISVINAPMIFKNGSEVPYLFEAYKFEDKQNLYFIGVGLDISIRHGLEQKQKQVQNPKETELNTTNLARRLHLQVLLLQQKFQLSVFCPPCRII